MQGQLGVYTFSLILLLLWTNVTFTLENKAISSQVSELSAATIIDFERDLD